MNENNNLFEELAKEYNIDLDNITDSYVKARIEIAKQYNESEGDLNKIDGYNCSLCKNRGVFMIVDENGNDLTKRCKCQKTRSIIARAKKGGFGNIITDSTFLKFEASEDWQKEIKNKALNFCNDNKAKWFYIGGQVGSGKTHICVAIAGHFIKSGYDVCYMLWVDDSKRLKSLANDFSYQEAIKQYKNADVLYIDDFLKTKKGEAPTTADLNLAFEIINHRLINNGKTTIISSEKMLDELLEYDEALMSRIYQVAGEYRINIVRNKAKNFRLKGSTK